MVPSPSPDDPNGEIFKAILHEQDLLDEVQQDHAQGVPTRLAWAQPHSGDPTAYQWRDLTRTDLALTTKGQAALRRTT